MAVVHGLMVLTQLDRGHGYLISNALGIVAATLFNFVGAKHFAFAPERLASNRPSAPPSADREREAPLSVGVQRAAIALLAGALVSTLLLAPQPLATRWLWVAIGFTALLPWAASPRAGLYSALLFATSPNLVAQSPQGAQASVSLALCAAGLYFAVAGTRRRNRSLCLLGGALLGLGALSGAFLAIPYALASCAFVLVQTTLGRSREEQPLSLRRSVLAGVLGFGLAAGARGWLAGAGLAGALGPVDLHVLRADDVTRPPLWAYLAELYRDYFYLLPLSLFGLPALLRRTRPHAIIVLAMAFAACLGLVMLSLTGVSQAQAVLAVAPFLYLMAGTSLVELDMDASTYRPANVVTVKSVTGLALGGAVLLWLMRLAGSSWITPRYALMHGAGMLACAGIGYAWSARRKLAVGLLLACALAIGAFATTYLLD
jgi:putative flippase GtrA